MFTRLYLICVYIDTQFVKYVHVARWHVWSQAAHQIKLLAAGSNRSASTCPDLLATHIRTASIIVAILPIHTSFKFLHHEAERCSVCVQLSHARDRVFSFYACLETHASSFAIYTSKPCNRQLGIISDHLLKRFALQFLSCFDKLSQPMHHQDLKRLHHILSCLVSNTQN